MNDSEAFANFINDLTPLNPEQKKYVIDNARVQSYPDGHLLLKEGEIMQNWYFVVKGCVRMYYDVDGLEKTTAFFEEQKVVNSWNSFLNQTPANHYLECIENCRLAVVSYEVDQEGYEKHAIFNKTGLIRMRRLAAHHEQIISSLLTQNSTQRYMNFVNEHPSLVQRIPQHQLATYLGMRPETLSRLRKKLSES